MQRRNDIEETREYNLSHIFNLMCVLVQSMQINMFYILLMSYIGRAKQSLQTQFLEFAYFI